MQAWKLLYRTARFSGVKFYVERAETEGGRRVSLKEFACSDAYATDDMGKRATQYQLDAYVVGSDYMARRDKLITALEAGQGTLIHPYLGTLTVICESWRVTESLDHGGQARFSLRFVVPGDAKAETSASRAALLSLMYADAVIADAVQAFTDTYTLVSRSSWVQSEAVSAIEGLIDAVSGGRTATGDGSAYAGVVNALLALSSSDIVAAVDAGTLGDSLVSLFAVADSSGSVTQLYATGLTADDSLTNATELLTLAATYVSATVGSASSSSTAGVITSNAVALNALAAQAAVAEAARSSATAEFETASDALAFMDMLTAAIDAVLEATSSDAVYQSMSDLRAAVVADLTTRAAQLPDRVLLTLSATLPALVICQQVYGDGARVDEFVARNGCRHPGFVSGEVETLQ